MLVSGSSPTARKEMKGRAGNSLVGSVEKIPVLAEQI
jgi:hypothetical protein